MQPLKTIVEKCFPDEIIEQQLNIKLEDTWKTGMSFGKFFYLKPLPMLETDKKIYFDKRIPLIYQSIISIVIAPIWMSFCGFVLQLIFHFNLPISFYGIIIAACIVVGIINLLINKYTLQNIFVINKSWITNRNKNNNREIISGHILGGNNSYLLLSFLTKEQKATLSFPDRFSSRVLFDTNFTLKIKPE